MPKATRSRILHIMSSHGGGISTFIHNLAMGINKYGIVFDVATFHECPPSFVEAIQRTGGDVYLIKNPKEEGWGKFKSSLNHIMKLYDYDIVHCHITGYRALAYKLIVERYSRAKFIIHAHYTIDDDRMNSLRRLKHYLFQRLNANLSEMYVGCSKIAVQSIFGYQIPDNQIIVIPNSIDEQKFMYSPGRRETLNQKWRETLGINSQTLVVGQIGRLTPIKNHRLTLQLAKHAKELQKDVQFVIFGAGELETDIRQSIAQNQLEDYVILAGRYQPIDEVYPLFDCVIMPSFHEGLGTVAIESQAAGVPIVYSNTLPYEANLNVGLVTTMKLTDSVSLWFEAIIRAARTTRVPDETRLMALNKYKYTNYQAVRYYATVVAGVRL